ncbi:MAG: PilZ domain-containing protein [Pirellulales bacterium]
MTVQTPDKIRGAMAIHELVLEAYDEGKRERRVETRYPFFRSVSLHVDGRCHTGFSREISAHGIGLMHDVELAPGELEVSLPSRRGHTVRMRVRILWCRSCGDGWHISGGQFVDIKGYDT